MGTTLAQQGAIRAAQRSSCTVAAVTNASDTPLDLSLPGGIPGFPQLRQATLSPFPEGVYAELTGSIDEGSISFVLAEPGAFFEDYTFDIDDATAELVDAAGQAPQVWVVLSEHTGGICANLRAPLLVNPVTGAAAQVVLDESFELAQALS